MPEIECWQAGEGISLNNAVSFHVIPMSLLVENAIMGAFAPRPTITKSTELLPSRLTDGSAEPWERLSNAGT
jgi:hypothetical protein